MKRQGSLGVGWPWKHYGKYPEPFPGGVRQPQRLGHPHRQGGRLGGMAGVADVRQGWRTSSCQTQP